jgi:hypothetical protein
MKLRLQIPRIPKKLNSCVRISNETSILKIGHFAKRWKPSWAQCRAPPELAPSAWSTKRSRQRRRNLAPGLARDETGLCYDRSAVSPSEGRAVLMLPIKVKVCLLPSFRFFGGGDPYWLM